MSRAWIKRLLVVAALVATAAIIAGCGGSSQPTSSPSTSSQGSQGTTAETAATNTATSGANSNTLTVVLTDEGGRFRIEPSTLTVKAGQTLTLVVENRGPSEHDFAIPDLNVATRSLAPGESETLQVTFPSGTKDYRMICSVPGHDVLGMVGTVKAQ